MRKCMLILLTLVRSERERGGQAGRDELGDEDLGGLYAGAAGVGAPTPAAAGPHGFARRRRAAACFLFASALLVTSSRQEILSHVR